MEIDDPNISEIISGCKAGKREAQEKLYRYFFRVMMNLCLRYTKNEADAMEVLNTGFYKVYKNIRSYDHRKGTIYTWIRTIIVHSCLDFIKSVASIATIGELNQASHIDVAPDVISKMSAEEILALLRTLPPATQLVFNMYVIEGYTHGEIAKLTGTSEGTSKWHLSEARKKMQLLITASANK